MTGLTKLDDIREYCNYVERHLLNVEKAWKILRPIVAETSRFKGKSLMYIDAMIELHDESKLSAAEFIAYAEWFFGPVGKQWDSFSPFVEGRHNEAKAAFDAAWEHHKENNPHHWQKWTEQTDIDDGVQFRDAHCVCMVCDWMAMGMEFGDTAQEYYERNRDTIHLPGWSLPFLQQLFSALDAAKDGQ